MIKILKMCIRDRIKGVFMKFFKKLFILILILILVACSFAFIIGFSYYSKALEEKPLLLSLIHIFFIRYSFPSSENAPYSL